MESEFKKFEAYVGCGRIARFTVKREHFLVVEFKDSQKGIAPMTINTPDLIVNALSEFEKVHANFKEILQYQGNDFVVYRLERIL
ncbi:hypothetical protein IKO50_03140 [bacterium]|jgi:hypothetical protein|nr:hypothetical protein [bacterium]